jgi:hypothetical protein
MSEDLYTKRTPEQVPQEDTEVNVFDAKEAKKGRRGLKALLAVGTTAVVLAGGIAIGARGGGDKVDAQAPPVATAPANPTEQPSIAPSEAAPTSNSMELDVKTFPILVDGEQYEGEKDFQAKRELRVEDFKNDDGSEDGSKLLRTFMAEAANQWMKSGSDKQTLASYADYTAKDGSATGAEAVGKDVYDNVFADTYTTDGVDGDFAATMAEIHKQYIQMRKTTSDTMNPYDGDLLGQMNTFIPSGTGDEITVFIKWGYKEGSQVGESQKKKLVFKEVPGSDGRPVYKLASFEASEVF